MFDDDNQDLNDNMVMEARRSTSPAAGGPRFERARAPTADAPVGLLERQTEPTVERPNAPPKPEEKDHGAPERARKGFFRRRPIATVSGLLLMALAGGGTYLYLDYAAHFESTDDAFIAARQFAIAPNVAGYITAVPVTDNEHVATGQVIARIDPRDYRAALEQAEAQVAAAQASVRNVDAQMDVQQAQINANQAQVDPGAGESGARAGHLGTRQAARPSGLGDGSAGHDRRAVQFSNAQQAAVDKRAGGAQAGAAANGDAEGSARERGGQCQAGRRPARPGAAQPFLYHGRRRATRPCRQPLRRGRRIRLSRDRALPCSCRTTSG